jgi:hypothetical protein
MLAPMEVWGVIVPAGVLMASVREIQEALGKIHWLRSVPLKTPSMLTSAVLVAVTPLGLLLVAMRGRRWRRAHKVLGLSLAAAGALQLGAVGLSPYKFWLYDFELVRGVSDSGLQAARLTRAQDWVLLEYDLALASARSEAPQVPRVPWRLDTRFLWRQGELTSPHDRELLQRAERLRSLSPGFLPAADLSECAEEPVPPQISYARCAPPKLPSTVPPGGY